MASRRRTKKIAVMLVMIALIMAGTWLTGGFFRLKVTMAMVCNEPSAVLVDAAKYDFGTVLPGPTLKARFRVTNVGGRRLILTRESSDCECLASDPELRLPPGAHCDLSATLETDELRGPIQSRIRYHTNDPRQPVLELTMVARVDPGPRK